MSTSQPKGALAWLPHVVFVALGLACVAIARGRHLTDDEARAQAADVAASTDARIWAAHVAANREHERDLERGAELVDMLLAAEDVRLREAALTTSFVRLTGGPPIGVPATQHHYVHRAIPQDHWTLHRFVASLIFGRKVGGAQYGGIERLDLEETAWLLDGLAGDPLPSDAELDAHFQARVDRARSLIEARRALQRELERERQTKERRARRRERRNENEDEDDG